MTSTDRRRASLALGPRPIEFEELLAAYDLAPPIRRAYGGVVPAIERDEDGDYTLRLVNRTGDHLRWLKTTPDGEIIKPLRHGPPELRTGRIVGIADAHDRYHAALRTVTRLDVEEGS